MANIVNNNVTAAVVEALQTCVSQCSNGTAVLEFRLDDGGLNNSTSDGYDCVEDCMVAACDAWASDDDGGGIGIPLAVSIVVAAVLICFSALFSGLTLGLLSLDLVALKVLQSAGDEKERKYAKKIIPIRTNGNLLLCTLLLGNTIVNNGLSILLADLTSGIVGLIVSVVAVLIFGEITPQAVCSRHALFIGSHTIYIVKFFRILFFPVCYPLSLVLNYFLGRDIGNVYTVDEIKRLIELHATDPDAKAESGLNESDHRLLVAALEYKDKRVKDVMTSLDQCYMLEASARLNFSTMLDVYKSGYTRIPVFSGNRGNIVGVLYAKDLILVDPEDEIELMTILSFRGRHGGHVFADIKLDKALARFLASGTHLMIVHARQQQQQQKHRAMITDVVDVDKDASTIPRIENGEVKDVEKGEEERVVHFALDPEHQEFGEAPGEEDEGEVVGIITLEDVIEEVIRTEIVDESDQWEDVEARVPSRIRRKNDIDAFLKMFERKESQDKGLSSEEVKAVCSFLALNVDEFALLGRHEVQIKTLVHTGTLIERSEAATARTLPGTPSSSAPQSPHSDLASISSVGRASDAFSRAMEDKELELYTKGHKSTHFILILQGKVEVHTSSEGFSFVLGPWSVLGNRALSQESYIPDFDAIAVPPCRILKIEKAAYKQALQSCKFSFVLEGRTLKRQIQAAAQTATEDQGQSGDRHSPSPSFGRSSQGRSRLGRGDASSGS
ncbi:Metal transporter CNNM2 [Picochlorum sp. SENEW3]|nr:Metal transporter CNNM2 [Picochlorum sp. SENEW3]